MSYYERLQGYFAEQPHVANEAADEESYPVQPPLSALEIAKGEQAALVVSAGMKQEFIDGPPVLDLTSRGWWGLLKALTKRCQDAGRCLGYEECPLGPAAPNPIAAAFEKFRGEIGHLVCECPCGQYRDWVLSLVNPKRARVGVADIVAWRTRVLRRGMSQAKRARRRRPSQERRCRALLDREACTRATG